MEQETADYEANGVRGLYADEDVKKTVYAAKADALINYGLGISSLCKRIESNGNRTGLAQLITLTKSEDFTADNIKALSTLGQIIMDLKHLYAEWEEKEYNPLMKALTQSNLFTDKNFYVDAEVLEKVRNLIFGGHMNCYKYKDGGDKISLGDKYHISSVIGFSSDLTMWFSHLQQQEEFLQSQPQNEVFVTLFGKLDDIADIYSSWVISLHKGNSIWIVTDQRKFDNAHQKRAQLERKGSRRDAESLREACDLPYHLFSDLDVLRAKNKGLATRASYKRHKTHIKKEVDGMRFEFNDKMGRYYAYDKAFEKQLKKLNIDFDIAYPEGQDERGFSSQPIPNIMIARKRGKVVAVWKDDEITVYDKPEVFLMPLADLHDAEKAFMVILTKDVMEYISIKGKKLTPIMLAHEFLYQKMLKGATINPSKPTSMEYWNADTQLMVNELLETIEEDKEKSTALALKSYDLVVKSKEYDASWLGTPQQLQSLAEWNVLDTESRAIYPKIVELARNAEAAERELAGMLNERYFSIREKIMTCEEIRFVTKKFQVLRVNENRQTGGHVISSSGKWLGADIHIGAEGGKCKCCGTSPARVVKKIEIDNYKELMWLMDLKDRKELPKYYRQFRGWQQKPYMGNSLLEQTHPYLDLQDPCSERHQHLIFVFYMCTKCKNKHKVKEKVVTIKY